MKKYGESITGSAAAPTVKITVRIDKVHQERKILRVCPPDAIAAYAKSEVIGLVPACRQ